MNNTIVISLEGIDDKKVLHQLLKDSLSLSDYYGYNLDALQDELSSVSKPLSVRLINTSLADPSMEPYVNNLISVFEDCARENENIKFDYNKIANPNKRREIAICGVWEDAENLNLFVRSMQSNNLSSQFVLACYTFAPYQKTSVKDTGADSNLIRLIKSNNPAALIIFAEMIKNPAIINALIAYGKEVGIPVFMFEHQRDNCINLQLEYKDAFREIVDHVVTFHRCRNIDMFAGTPGNKFSDERISVYKEVLEEHGIPFDVSKVHYGDFWGFPARRVMENLLDNGYSLPEAIICANDSMAVGIIDLLQERGYNIPNDCIVTGFDGISQAKYHNPSVTTAIANYESISDLIVGTINNWTPDMNFVTETYPIEFDIVCTQSCGCVDHTHYDWAGVVSELAEANRDYFYHQLEMGKFLTRTIGMNSPELACSQIEPSLWQWTDQYYLIVISEDDHLQVAFQRDKKTDSYSNSYYNLKSGLPDEYDVMRPDSGYNVFLYADISSNNVSYGYLCCGYEKINLRIQQRFEEYVNYVSGVTHSVVKNRMLMSASEEIEKLSGLDYLTGLQNRRGFFKLINEELNKPDNAGKYFTLFSIDMDSLKHINDTYGHQDGDIAIKVLADAITECTSSYLTCAAARYGGDEFALFVIDNNKISVKAEALRERIETIASKDTRINQKDYKIKASIGASDSIIDSSFNIEQLLYLADEAMYKDKQNRKKNKNQE